MSEETAKLQAAEIYKESNKEISQYVDILLDRGLSWGLLGPREGERIWGRHILNSVAVSQLIPQECTVVDMGSGAGLPGIPLAILRPDLMITLLEPLQRRVQFLELAVTELGLGERVRVVRGRAEEHKERYDVVTCRAVANLTKLLAWATPLFLDPLDKEGQLVALKGESVVSEVAKADKELRKAGLVATVHHISAHSEAEPTYAAVVKKR
ncbi:MAG: 16S rRNA (guanine(527)-N(7))-methyltransferase RsmG [Propionibacteriaceae bacterium]